MWLTLLSKHFTVKVERNHKYPPTVVAKGHVDLR